MQEKTKINSESTANKTIANKQSARGQKKKMFIRFIVYLTLLALVVFAAWSFYGYQEAKKKLLKLSTVEGQQEVQQREIDELLAQLKRHMLLPEDEQPTIATVTDIDELKGQQPFFEKASNGDKVVIYVNNHKAIIYSPEKDMIINVGTLVVDNPNAEQSGQQQQQQQAEVSEELKIEIRNGSQVADAARTVSSELNNKNDKFNFETIGEASKKDYQETMVVDLNAPNKQLAKALADELNTQLLTELPEGEEESNAEVVVIVGRDQVRGEAASE